jgi:penicillin-binding protein 1B
VYAAAFESGISPLSLFRDAPQTFDYGNASYAPANYGKGYSMQDVMLREGLVRSLNVVTVDLAMRTGLAKVAGTAERFGLPRPDPYPSMALGTFEATPLQIAAAYAAFANGGTVHDPTFLIGTGDPGEQPMPPPEETRQVISPTTAYMITDILSDVIKRGTARHANGSLNHVAIAGKTGTSRDGWFVGYTPNLVCVVWIGFDDNEQLGMTGAEAALPAWIDFMKEAVAVRPSLGGTSFPKPGGIITVKVDPETGALAGADCPSSQMVSVAYRFAPAVECYKHLPPVESDVALSETGTDISSTYTDLTSEPVPQPELNDKSLQVPAEADENPDSVAPTSKSTRRRTQTEVNERGQTRLISDPTLDLSNTRRPRAPRP